MINTYKKIKDTKKVNTKTINQKLYDICNELLKYNDDATFAISKKFILKPDGSLGDEIKSIPYIISTIPVNNLTIPSCFKLIDQAYISTWCDNDPIVEIKYKSLVFEDGNINDKQIKNLYMKIK